MDSQRFASSRLLGRSKSSRTRRAHDRDLADVDAGGRPLAPPYELPEARLIRVAVPAQVQAVKSAALDIAQLWRASTRHAFEGYFDRGYRVVSFYRQPREPRGYYVLQAADG